MKLKVNTQIEVFQRDERTGDKKLVHTSFKKLGPCIACKRVLSGDIILIGNHMIHKDCGKLLG